MNIFTTKLTYGAGNTAITIFPLEEVKEHTRIVWYVGVDPVSPRRGWFIGGSDNSYFVIDTSTKQLIHTWAVFDDEYHAQAACITKLQLEIQELVKKANS